MAPIYDFWGLCCSHYTTLQKCGDTEAKLREGAAGQEEEKELQLSSQTRTICLICVTCFLLI